MILLISFLSLFGTVTPQLPEKADPEFQMIVERLNYDQFLPYDEEKVHLPDLIMELYQYSEFEEIWQNEEEIEALIELLTNAHHHGLNPDDYHVGFLTSYYEQRNEDSHLRYYYDLLLSDATFFFSHHITSGKIGREFSGTWNYPARDNYLKYMETFYDHVKNGSMVEELEKQKPDVPLYDFLMEERRRLHDLLEKNGEFSWIPDGVTIHPGDTFQYLPEVSKRIHLLGYSKEARLETVYSEVFQEDVEHFQKSHGLDTDGVIGKGTFDMLNLRIKDRMDIIDVNLERIRWAISASEKDVLIVNIAGFHLYYFRDDKLYWDTDVMTGAIDTQTPVFVSDMKYVVFNPTWTVPRSIVNKSLFRRMKGDPSYLKKHNYYLVDSGGKRVDESTIDWPSMTLGKFAYNVVQSPGAHNALGRVKFIFPNKYAIYLHDTPSKHLFSRTSRAFSHGCIRVKDPLELAEILLDDKEGYSTQDIRDIIKTEKTKTVFLTNPLRVILIYLTVSDTDEGLPVYYPDIYNRDQEVLELLRSPIL